MTKGDKFLIKLEHNYYITLSTFGNLYKEKFVGIYCGRTEIGYVFAVKNHMIMIPYSKVESISYVGDEKDD